MSDEQVHRRMISKRLLIVSALLIILAGAMLYWRYTKQPELQTYRSQIAQEKNLQSQVDALQQTISQLSATIEQNGKQLVSFGEDKIVYINLASSLSSKYSVDITRLSVSDVWYEGQMAGMTTELEIEGSLASVRGFVNDYCGTKYTNRISVVSFRPDGPYPWMERAIDGTYALGWLDLAAEQAKYDRLSQAEKDAMLGIAGETGLPSQLFGNDDDLPITLADMFRERTFKFYVVVDFLGRQ